MSKKIYTLSSKVIVYPGNGGWRFIGLPTKEGKEIKEKYGAHAKGWGSLPVLVTIGKTSWNTSIFPDKRSGSYLLPVKAQVRKAEGIYDGDMVKFSIRIQV